jgi:hypothetical protein
MDAGEAFAREGIRRAPGLEVTLLQPGEAKVFIP